MHAMQHRNRIARRRTDGVVAGRQVSETTCHSPAHAWVVIESVDLLIVLTAKRFATESKKPDEAHLPSEVTMKSGDDYPRR